jgi:hypothetical protein
MLVTDSLTAEEALAMVQKIVARDQVFEEALT